VVVRELVALLGIKTDKKSMDKAEGGMKKLISFAKAAAVAFGAFKIGQWAIKAAESVAKIGDQFDKMSHRTGVAFDALQGFSHAAQLSGASIQDVEMSIKRLQASQADAAFGLKTYTREFERLGIEIKDTDGNFKDTTTLLLEVADGMKNLDSDTERTAVAVKLLGRSGTNLIPLLKQGSGSIREMMEEARDLGAIMDEDLRKASVDYIDNQQRLNMMWQGVSNVLGQELLPLFNRMTNATIDWWKANRKWIMERIAPKIKEIVMTASRFIKTIGKMVFWVVKLVKNLPAGAKIGLIAIAFLKWGKALRFLFSPFGKLLILIGLIVLIIDDLITFVEGGDSVFGKFFETLDELTGLPISDMMKDIIKWFQKLAEDPAAAFQDLVDMMEGVIGWWADMFEGIWQDTVEFFKGLWNGLLEWFQSSVVQPIVDFFTSMWEDPMAAVEGFLDFLMDIGERIIELIMAPWKEALTFIKDVFEVGIVEALNRLGEKVRNWANGLLDTIAAPFKKAASFLGLMDEEPKGAVGGAVGAGARTALAAGAMGQGVIPGAARAAATAGVSNINQKTDVQINVKGTPGMSEAKLGGEVARQVGAMLEKQNRAAMNALVPKAS